MRRKARLAAARTLSPSVRELTLEVDPAPDGAPFSYAAGQYVELFVPTKGLTMKRAYSIASAPGSRGPNAFDIAVTRTSSGKSSDSLHSHALDAEYDVEGPRGGFVRRNREASVLFVGAGTGLAPLRAMIQDELRTESQARVGLLFGARDEDHILWRAEWNDWSASRRFESDITLSRASETWSGLRGYVQLHAVRSYEKIAPAEVFVCGLSSMVIDVVRALEAHGVDSSAIYSESYD
ncbi:MAG: FAD-dependent oxidoreductase [Polyangiaceae bacterium]